MSDHSVRLFVQSFRFASEANPKSIHKSVLGRFSPIFYSTINNMTRNEWNWKSMCAFVWLLHSA